jgi:hypothetical protein
MSVLEASYVYLCLVGVDIRADTAALDRDREKYSCHSLQRHSRCDAAGVRTTFDGPKTFSPSLLPWLADTASAGRSSYFFSFRLLAGASIHSSWPLGQVAFRRHPSSNAVRGTFSKVNSRTPDLSLFFLFFSPPPYVLLTSLAAPRDARLAAQLAALQLQG